MKKTEFSRIRKRLGKTQKQMAQLLGTSLKAVQSFEQGWRNIPVHVERQLLFLIARHDTSRDQFAKCWDILECSPETRDQCPAWEMNTGDLCWFINGTICQGEPQKNWQDKMKACRKCRVFKNKVPRA